MLRRGPFNPLSALRLSWFLPWIFFDPLFFFVNTSTVWTDLFYPVAFPSVFLQGDDLTRLFSVENIEPFFRLILPFFSLVNFWFILPFRTS